MVSGGKLSGVLFVGVFALVFLFAFFLRSQSVYADVSCATGRTPYGGGQSYCGPSDECGGFSYTTCLDSDCLPGQVAACRNGTQASCGSNVCGTLQDCTCVTDPNPTVASLSASTTSGTVTFSSTLTWACTNGGTISNYTGNFSPAPSGSSGSQNITYTSAGTYPYSIECRKSNGQTSTASTSVTANAPSAPNIDVVVSGSFPLPYSGSATYGWSLTNGAPVNNCYLIVFNGASSSSNTYASGTGSGYSTGSMYPGANVSGYCTGPGGQGGTDTETVSVSPAPTASISAQSGSIAYGASTTINWSSTNTSTCSINANGVFFSNLLNGSQSTGALTTNTTYTISCKNSVGYDSSGNQSVNVTVGAPPTLSCSPQSQTFTGTTSATLTASGGYGALSWVIASGGGSLSSSTGNSTTLNGSYNTTYQVRVSDQASQNSTCNIRFDPTAASLTCSGPSPSQVSQSMTASFTASPSGGTGSAVTWKKNGSSTGATGNSYSANGWNPNQTNTVTAEYEGQSCPMTFYAYYDTSCSVDTTSPIVGQPVNIRGQGGTGTYSNWNVGSGTITASGNPVITATFPSAGTYTVTLNSGTMSGSCQVAVANPPAPTVNLSLSPNPTSLASPNTTTVTWTVSGNATSCTATGNWSGSKNSAGDSEPINLTSSSSTPYSFSISCSNAGGSSPVDTETITIYAPPQITLSSSNGLSGTAPFSTTLSWSKTSGADPTSCTASGSWSGSKVAPPGTEQILSLSAGSYTYKIKCSLSPGSLAIESNEPSVTITVNNPTASVTCTRTTNPAVTGSPVSFSATKFGGTGGAVTWSGGGSPATGTGDTFSTTWSSPGSQNSVVATYEGATSTCPGFYVYEALGCTPAASFTTAGQPIQVNWKGGTGTSYTWSVPSGTYTGTNPITVTYATPGNYTITTSESGFTNGTCNVQVKYPTPTITFTASTPVNHGGASTLTWSSQNATSCSATTGPWTVTPVNATSGTTSSTALNYAQVGQTYTFTIYCSNPDYNATQSAVVNVNPPTLNTCSVSNIGVTSATVGSTGGFGNYTWSVTPGASLSPLSTTNGGSSTLTGSAGGSYTVTVQDQASQSKTCNVQLNNALTCGFTSSTNIPQGGTVTTTSANGSSPYTWGATGGTVSGSGASVNITYASPGTYSVSLQSAGQNVSCGTVTVTSTAIPICSLSHTKQYVNTNLTATGTSGDGTFNWSGGGTPATGTGSSFTTQYASTGFKTITVTSGTGQTNTCQVEIVALPNVTCSGPASLSLNQNGTFTATPTGGMGGAVTWTKDGSSTGVTGNSLTTSFASPGNHSVTAIYEGDTDTCPVSVTAPAPTLTFSASPTSVNYNSATTLTWSTTNATSCTASNGWTGVKATSGTESSSSLTSNTTFTLSCDGPGGSVTQNVSVSVNAPSITQFSASPNPVNDGAITTITWSSANASSCTAGANSYGFSTGGATSGNDATTGLPYSGSPHSFTLTCSGNGIATLTIQVGVNAPGVTATLTATPSSVSYNGTTTLTWSSSGATSCTADTNSYGFSTGGATSGSDATTSITANTTFSISCTGPGGTANASAAVTVDAPSANLTVNTNTVNDGGTVDLTWSSSSVSSCTATQGPGFNTGGSVSGFDTSDPLSYGSPGPTYFFTVACTGTSTYTDTEIVSVNASPAPSCNAAPNPQVTGQAVVFTASGGNGAFTWSGGGSPASGSGGTFTTTYSTTGTKTVTVTSGGQSANCTVQINASTPINVNLTYALSPGSGVEPNDVTLSWDILNETADFCLASGSWSGSKSTTSGSSEIDYGKTAGTYTYTLYCSNSSSGRNHTDTETVTITQNSLPPTVALSLEPNQITPSGSTVVTWSITDGPATSCTATSSPSLSGWSGAKSSTSSSQTLSATASSNWCNDSTGVSCNTSWTTRRKITFNNSASTENLVNFPVLIQLSSSNIDYSKTQNSGQDIRFVDPSNDNLALNHEIETWNESGASYVWVNVPQIDAGSTTDYIWMYYNNASAPDGQNVSGVWNSAYQAVWHLNETVADEGTAAGVYNDSTTNNNDGTQAGPDDVASKIAKGQVFDGVADYINGGSAASLDNLTARTVSMWVKRTNTAADQTLIAKEPGGSPYVGWGVGMRRLGGSNGPGKVRVSQGWSTSPNTGWAAWYGSTDVIDTNAWYHVAVSYDGTSATNDPKIYVNGNADTVTEISTPSGTIANDPASNLSISSTDSASEILDEVRVSNVIRSGEWIEAEYLYSADNARFTYSTEEAYSTGFTPGVYDLTLSCSGPAGSSQDTVQLTVATSATADMPFSGSLSGTGCTVDAPGTTCNATLVVNTTNATNTMVRKRVDGGASQYVTCQAGGVTGKVVTDTITVGTNVVYELYNAPTCAFTPSSGVPANVVVWWENGASIPSGWTCISCSAGQKLFNVFPYISDTTTTAGGSATHTHTLSFSSVGLGATASAGASTNATASSTHSHGFPNITSGTGNNEPPYQSLVAIKSVTATTLPAGAIMLFDSASIPSGWTRVTALDSVFLRGSTSTSIGGAYAHTHTYSGTSGSASGSSNMSSTGTSKASSTHTHQITSQSLVSDNINPEYVNLVFAKSGVAESIPAASLSTLVDASPTDWASISATSSSYYHKFIKGSATPGGIGGSISGHNHTGSVTATSSAPSATVTRTGSGSSVGSSSHTHSFTFSITTDNTLPPYQSVVLAKHRFLASVAVAATQNASLAADVSTSNKDIIKVGTTSLPYSTGADAEASITGPLSEGDDLTFAVNFRNTGDGAVTGNLVFTDTLSNLVAFPDPNNYADPDLALGWQAAIYCNDSALTDTNSCNGKYSLDANVTYVPGTTEDLLQFVVRPVGASKLNKNETLTLVYVAKTQGLASSYSTVFRLKNKAQVDYADGNGPSTVASPQAALETPAILFYRDLRVPLLKESR